MSVLQAEDEAMQLKRFKITVGTVEVDGTQKMCRKYFVFVMCNINTANVEPTFAYFTFNRLVIRPHNRLAD